MFKLIALLQDSEPYDSGYDIGYTIGKYLPLILIIVAAYFLFRYFNKKPRD